jgi:hypothetical protein
MPRKCSCGKYASFNVPGETKGVSCSKCKTVDMVDVVSKKCPCGKQPSFNIPGKKPMYCSKCKTDGMVDVVSKKCSCGRHPKFNVTGEKKGVACEDCKTDIMIDVVSRRCSCGKTPSFNVPEQTIAAFCAKCKTDEMINVRSKKCSCGNRSSFNMSGQTIAAFCSKCKTDEMINVVNKRCPCGTLSLTYNVPGEKVGICCVRCKTPKMIDVKSKICPGYSEPCPVRTYVSRGNEYCMSCDPDDRRRKRFKLHEEAFFDYVKDKIDVHKREYHVKFDQNDTSNKFARLDGIVFGDGIIVCIEVDENGHRDYDCDEHRMHLVNGELLQLYPDHNISWVRVNPSVKSSKTRNKRFDDVIESVNDILKRRDTRVVYVGFD